MNLPLIYIASYSHYFGNLKSVGQPFYGIKKATPVAAQGSAAISQCIKCTTDTGKGNNAKNIEVKD